MEVALGGPQALSVIPRFQPEIILLDIGMPGMDGYAVARHIRASPEGQGVLLVALTGWGQEKTSVARAKRASMSISPNPSIPPAEHAAQCRAAPFGPKPKGAT